jgi:hypothetical protein
MSVPRAGTTRKNVKSKKAVRTDPGEKPTALWAIDTPCGVGIRSNGFLAGFLTSNNGQIMAGSFNECQYPMCLGVFHNLLAGSSSFPLACAYTAPHLNQASPLVTNTAGGSGRTS